jgi:hypothetical protein
MTDQPTPSPTPELTPAAARAQTIVAHHADQIRQMQRDIAALLPPDDAQKHAALASAFATFQTCQEQLTEHILLLMPTP